MNNEQQYPPEKIWLQWHGEDAPPPWIAVGDRMPTTGRKVIVCGKWPSGARWITTAKWHPARTLDASDWDNPPEDWWDEDQEKCTNPADGWMEESIEGETSWALSKVTHWMALPALPNCHERND